MSKSDLKNTTGADTSDFLKKADLASLKSDVDKLDIDKLKNVPSDLSSLKSKVDKLDVYNIKPIPADLKKLSDFVKKRVVKKDVYDELVKKVNAILTTDTTDLVKKLATTQKLMKLKTKLLLMIMINILLLKNLVS